jgi:hypothetical protein
VVTDRNRMTGGGVTAGLDLALAIVAQIVGPDLAAALQLMGELPIEGTPFGDPATSPPELVDGVRAQFEALSPGLTEFLARRLTSRRPGRTFWRPLLPAVGADKAAAVRAHRAAGPCAGLTRHAGAVRAPPVRTRAALLQPDGCV